MAKICFAWNIIEPSGNNCWASRKEFSLYAAGLEKAGRYIGYLERRLIITFILVDQWVAIGFLFTAKSIFRFEEAKTGKAEYFLLGTLFSFTFGILWGILGNYVLQLFY